jgi:hypothetical protein
LLTEFTLSVAEGFEMTHRGCCALLRLGVIEIASMQSTGHLNWCLLLCYTPEYYYGPIDLIRPVLYNLVLQSVDGDE